MIIFYGEGRLGNQVLQYQALGNIVKPEETILAIGLEDLQQVFVLQGSKLVVLTKILFIKRIAKYALIPLLIRPLARTLRLINYVSEPNGGAPPHIGATGELRLQHGLIGSITFVDGGYYQNAQLWPVLFPSRLLTLNKQLHNAAHDYLASVVPVNSIPVFVHVRRGDYLSYSSYGLSDFVLPVTFYRDAMRNISKTCPTAHFVFVTDDANWVIDTFKEIANKSVASFNPRLDFAIMATCRGGVLSNSTFSLAAAFMLDQPDCIIAPRYWFGFRVNQWYPPRIQITHEKIHYIPVLDQSI